MRFADILIYGGGLLVVPIVIFALSDRDSGTCKDTLQIVPGGQGQTVSCSEKHHLDTKQLDDGTMQVICRCKLKYR